MPKYDVDVKAFKVFTVDAENEEVAQEIADGMASLQGWEVDGESEVELTED